VQKFYQGLTMASRTIIDASAGGIHHRAYADRSFHSIQEGRGQ
jgi:hypothetical protein